MKTPARMAMTKDTTSSPAAMVSRPRSAVAAAHAIAQNHMKWDRASGPISWRS